MSDAPESYLDSRRPPLLEALGKEAGDTVEEQLYSLTLKGYFTPPPRPWAVGFHSRGNGHGDFGIIDKFGDLIAKVENLETADFIVAAVNSYKEV